MWAIIVFVIFLITVILCLKASLGLVIDLDDWEITRKKCITMCIWTWVLLIPVGLITIAPYVFLNPITKAHENGVANVAIYWIMKVICVVETRCSLINPFSELLGFRPPITEGIFNFDNPVIIFSLFICGVIIIIWLAILNHKFKIKEQITSGVIEANHEIRKRNEKVKPIYEYHLTRQENGDYVGEFKNVAAKETETDEGIAVFAGFLPLFILALVVPVVTAIIFTVIFIVKAVKD